MLARSPRIACILLVNTSAASIWLQLVKPTLTRNIFGSFKAEVIYTGLLAVVDGTILIRDSQYMEVTSERLTLGKSQPLQQCEHLARYLFAAEFVVDRDVADIACGTGYGSLMLARAGAKSVHGMDISAEAIEYCKEQNEAPNVFFSMANAQNLCGIADSTFDIVISFETIEHLPSIDAYLDEILRILRPGGLFLVSTPDRRIGSVLFWLFRRPQNHFHVREMSERELLKQLSSRFQIETRFGQAFVPYWLVFWPIQLIIKAFCRLVRSPALFKFRDNLYSNGGDVEVTKAETTSGIPKFWVILCKKRQGGKF